LFGGSPERGAETGALPEARVRELIAEVVEGTDPRIRALGNHRRRLEPAVRKAHAYFARAVAEIPAAVAMNRTTWADDALVHALFSSVKDLQTVFSKSKLLREFFDRHPGNADHCYLSLNMLLDQKTVLGMQLQGENVRRDVRQTTVSFVDHRIVLPSASEQELRERLVLRGFRLLVAYALEELSERQNRIAVMEEQRLILQSRLRAARARSAGLEALGGADAEQRARPEQLTQELEKLESELKARRDGFDSLDDYLELVREILERPERHVSMRPRSLFLSRMNLLLEPELAERGREVRLLEVELGDVTRVLVLVQFPREELLPKGYFLSQAERYYS
jgi:hypothetical protein